MTQEIADLCEILKWYIEAGVDQTCNDVCYQPNTEQKDGFQQPSFRQATTDLSQNIIASKQNAREQCSLAHNLQELKKIVENFDGCALKLTAKSTVFGAGNEKASLMIIGEAPGADEDRIGLPFVGRSGRLLDKMLQSIFLKRDDVYITNVLPWRPPGNRTPTDSEVAICLPFLKKQIELIEPKIILLLGASAANALLDNTESISRLRGKWLNYATSQNKIISALATFHPAFLLRNSAQKAKAWVDFLRILKKLKEN